MKKILLATTLLAASAGFAAAEVAVSGSARMGVIDTGAGAQFTSRVRINFDATGTTDGGLEFGASVRNDQSGVGNTANGDSTVFIKGAFGKLTMGDTGNASDALLGQVSGVGLTGLKDMNEIDFLAKDTTGALYEYSAGAISFALGAGQTNTALTYDSVTLKQTGGYDALSAAVKYSTDAFTVGLAYETNTTHATAAAKGVDNSQTTLFGSATFSGATVKAKIVDGDMTPDTQYALSVDYAISGANITAYYADKSTNGKAYGLGASYDLGGGASVVGGIAKAEGGKTMYDLGVKMSF